MKKLSKNKIAVTYATALYQVALAEKALEKVKSDVEKLDAIVKAEADFVKYLSNPIWDEEDKKEVLQKIAAKVGLSGETLRCLDVIVDNHRFAELTLILNEFSHVYYAKNNVQEVEVESVKNLNAAQMKKLQNNLEKNLQKKVIIAYKIQPELIGGLRIKYGSEMVDSSIASKLNRLEIVMKGGQ